MALATLHADIAAVTSWQRPRTHTVRSSRGTTNRACRRRLTNVFTSVSSQDLHGRPERLVVSHGRQCFGWPSSGREDPSAKPSRLQLFITMPSTKSAILPVLFVRRFSIAAYQQIIDALSRRMAPTRLTVLTDSSGTRL